MKYRERLRRYWWQSMPDNPVPIKPAHHAPVYVPSHYDNRHQASALERAVRGMTDEKGEGSGDGPT